MAATEEMLEIAKKILPDYVTLVPEKREEVTTEGGLDLKSNVQYLKKAVGNLKDSNIEVSAFIDPLGEQINYSKEIGFDFIEYILENMLNYRVLNNIKSSKGS